MTTALKTQVGAELSERELQILRSVQMEPTGDYEWRRDMPRLEALGLVDRSPYPASLSALAGSHVRRLTDAGKAVLEAFYP